MAQDFAAFSRKLAKIERDLTDAAAFKRLAEAAKNDTAQAVRGDLADLSMSNWHRGRPIQIKMRAVVKRAESQIKVSPMPRARGPMRVLSDGRRAGRARSGRPVSASPGKGTWDDAVALMAQRFPGRVHRELQTVLRRHLTGR